MRKVSTRDTARNIEWDLHLSEDGTWPHHTIQFALLNDIRAELRALNAKLTGVGPTVHQIERNTRGARHCSRCGAGPYGTARGLRQHYRVGHAE